MKLTRMAENKATARLIPAICFALLALGSGWAQAGRTLNRPAARLQFNISQMGADAVCSDKGRLLDSDYTSKSPSAAAIVKQVLAGGKDSVPVLIDLMASTKPTAGPIICYWDRMTVGEVAFLLLENLFTDPSGKPTIEGVGFDQMLERGADKNISAANLYRNYVKKHGADSLQTTWRAIWQAHEKEILWDAKDHCFRIRSEATEH